jgi:hypothetical protein
MKQLHLTRVHCVKRGHWDPLRERHIVRKEGFRQRIRRRLTRGGTRLRGFTYEIKLPTFAENYERTVGRIRACKVAALLLQGWNPERSLADLPTAVCHQMCTTVYEVGLPTRGTEM